MDNDEIVQLMRLTKTAKRVQNAVLDGECRFCDWHNCYCNRSRSAEAVTETCFSVFSHVDGDKPAYSRNKMAPQSVIQWCAHGFLELNFYNDAISSSKLMRY